MYVMARYVSRVVINYDFCNHITFFYLIVSDHRYAIHLWDLHHEGVWESRGIFIYYSELIFEMATLCIDFTHHLHMLVSVGTFALCLDTCN